MSRPEAGLRSGALLHIGCGDKRLEGWINVDLKPLPGVDVVADVTSGLHFEDVQAIFSEHFLEHLPVEKALDFLLEAHRVLKRGGWIRLSTPNLDWVWSTHYALDSGGRKKVEQAIMLNRAFRGWGHQFLWNPELLAVALEAAGFENLRWCRYGESDLEPFRGIERHETYGDSDDLPHVLIAEAQKGEQRRGQLEAFRERLRREFLVHVDAK